MQESVSFSPVSSHTRVSGNVVAGQVTQQVKARATLAWQSEFDL